MDKSGIAAFARSYREAGCPMDRELMKRVYLTDVSTSVLVWRDDPYLVELYFMHPGAVVVPHSHPFETIGMFWSGELRGGRGTSFGPLLTNVDGGFIGQPLSAGEEHFFEVGSTGAVLYTLSRWDDPADMDSATMKYIGQPLGERHAKQLGKA